ncbi:MAG: hypothetical protein U0L54_02260, partial [Bacteroidales bacterium]|nr:hypothetical protein [Bacteroidales bacterium]
MKKIYVKKQRFSMTKYLFVLFIILSINVKAQYNFVQPPNPATYDLLYVFDTSFFANCFSTDNQMQTEFDYDSPWGVQHLAPP